MDLSSTVKTILPWISTALTGGPVGVAVMAANKVAEYLGVPASSIGTEDAKAALNDLPPDKLLEFKKAELEFQAAMQARGYDHVEKLVQADVDIISQVNATMREEIIHSATEEWYQKAWRPACGFSIAIGSFVATVYTCFLINKAIAFSDVAALNAIPQLAISISTILAIPGAAVGIASWHRGQAERERIKTDGSK